MGVSGLSDIERGGEVEEEGFVWGRRQATQAGVEITCTESALPEKLLCRADLENASI